MTSLEQAQEQFLQAISGLESAFTAAAQRHKQMAGDLAALQARHAALEAEHAALRKSYEALHRQHAAASKRLDGAIAGLHEVLGG